MQEMNGSREYLNQLKKLDVCIKQKQEELRDLRSLAVSERVNSKSVRVQVSQKSDRIADIVVKIVCLENEVCSEIEDLAQTKHKIINEIQSLNDDTYISILFKKYVEYKTLNQIAFEMNYSYDRTKHLHGFALNSFKIQHSILQ